MKTTNATAFLLIVWLWTGAVYAQKPGELANPKQENDYELTLEELPDAPSIAEALQINFGEQGEWTIGDGCNGYQKELFLRDYNQKKELVPGKPCTPFFKLKLGDFYLEGQLFENSFTKISGLIRGFDGNYHAVSGDFMMGVFKLQYLCLGLPSSDWSMNSCEDSNLPYKLIDFTILGCQGERKVLTLVGLYSTPESYSECLELDVIPDCPFLTLKGLK